MRVAVIKDGVVESIMVAAEDWRDHFPDVFGVESEAASVGDLYDAETGALSAPAPAPPTIAELLAAASDKRWRVETGGIEVAGVPIDTSDRSKMLIMGARLAAESDPAFTTTFAAIDGTHTLSAAEIIAISDAVLAHVAACFAQYGVVESAVRAGLITTVEQVLAADWPETMA